MLRGLTDSGQMTNKRNFTRLFFGLTLMAAPVVVATAAPATNWLLSFATSVDGGHIIGNPAATTKVVEYASYTCGHCGHFESDDVPVLKRDYIAKGKVNLEIRNLVRDPVDLTVALLARCGGKARFFGNHRHFMVTQSQWMPKSQAISDATEAKLKSEDYVGFMTGAYRDMGLGAFAKQRGISDAQAMACLKDPAAFKTVLTMTDRAVGPLAITGTPSFLINGKVKPDVKDLATMRPHLPK
jgi:protein-disulfide isomerase